MLQFGETFLCSLAVSGEVDQYTFSASAGDRVFARLASRSTGLQPQIRILDSTAKQLCNAASSSAVADIDGCEITDTGIYTLLVNDYYESQTGSYGLSIQRLNKPANANAVIFGQTQAAALIAAGEVDSYTLTAKDNESIFIRVATTTSSLNPHLRIYKPDGSKHCEAASYSAIVDLDACPLLMSGTYTVIVTTYRESLTGNYSLAVQRLNEPVAATSTAYGHQMTSTLAAAGEIDTYVFSAVAQDAVLLRMGTELSVFNPQLRLYRRDGTKICQGYSYGMAGELGPCLIPSTGEYVALITSFDTVATGVYGLTLQNVARPRAPLTVTPGVLHNQVLTTTGQFATYAASLKGGDSLFIRLGTTSSNFDPHIRVFGSDGAKICEGYSYSQAANVGPCLIPRDGSYSILVNPLNEPTVGEYAMTIQLINRPAQAVPLYFGRTKTGQIQSSGSLDSYIFRAQANSTVLLRLTVASTAVDPFVQIFSRDGTRICSAYSYGTTTEISRCLLPMDGDYTVLTTSLSGGASSYSLALACLSDTCGAVQPPEERIYLPVLMRQ